MITKKLHFYFQFFLHFYIDFNSVESVLENNAKTIEENKKIDLSGLDDMLGDLFEDTNKEKDIKGFEISFKEEK